MRPSRIPLLILGLVLVALSWWQVMAVRQGLVLRQIDRDGLPLLYVAPNGTTGAPGVLVAHGFAGSKQLMLGYACTLARAGYAALLWDFDGHGANGRPLRSDALQGNLDAAYAALIEQPEVDSARVALVGHSMGSGAVMTAGIRHPARYTATVAISPTAADVTPDAPRNLLLQAGSLEGRFVANAQRLLAASGGASVDFTAGRGRMLTIIPNAEHISILFRAESHRAVLDWLGRAFGEPRDTSYVDRRILWYLAHLAGWLLVLVAVAPAVRPRGTGVVVRRRWLPWVGLVVGPLAASGVLAAADRVVPMRGFGGLTVGGAVGLWFLVAGLVWLAAALPARVPSWRDLAWGVGLFALLWLAFGAMAQFVWVQWLLILPRLARWPLLALASAPWFLAAGLAQVGAGTAARALWWLAQSIMVIAGLLIALALVPAMGFLVLLMPLLPVIFGILGIAAGALGRPWAYGVGAALFFGWVIAAVFPLAG